MRGELSEVRLAPPPPRGLHRPARQVLRRVPQLPVVPGRGARAEGDGDQARVREVDSAQRGGRAGDQGLRVARRLHVRHVLGDRHVRHRARRARRRHRRPGLRRRPARPARPVKLDYSRTLAFKDFRLELDPFLYKFSGHRRHAGGGAARAQQLLHAVRLLRQERSGADDAGPGPRQRRARVPRAEHRLPALHASRAACSCWARSRAPTR